jgi:hypothetical protein
MRRIGLLAAALGLAASPTAAGPPAQPAVGVAFARAGKTTPRPAWWRAGGVTPCGTVWHAGGGTAAWGGAYRSGWAHGVVHCYCDSSWARAGWARPVPVAGWYPPGAAAAGTAAVFEGLAGTTAAASAYHYAQPPTVVNNYYGY